MGFKSRLPHDSCVWLPGNSLMMIYMSCFADNASKGHRATEPERQRTEPERHGPGVCVPWKRVIEERNGDLIHCFMPLLVPT